MFLGCMRVRGLVVVAALISAGVVGAAASPAAAATDQTLYVSATSTNTTTPCTSSSDPCTLSTAIGEANGDSGDAIQLADGTYTAPTAGFPTITSSQTWNGASQSGTILHGVSGMSAAIVTVRSGPVALNDLTLTGGTSSAGEGGAIDNIGSTLTVSDDTFSNNYAIGFVSQGGAIETSSNGSSGSLTVKDCTFSDNGTSSDNVENFGGAIDSADSGLINRDTHGTLTISGSTFTGNRARQGVIAQGISGFGGGTANGSMSISNSRFIKNLEGGAITNGWGTTSGSTGVGTPGIGTAVITNSTFSDNGGGAIVNGQDGGAGTLKVTGTTFADNVAGAGGAIDNGDFESAGTLTVADSTFVGNWATDLNRGGAIDNAEGGIGNMSVVHSTFVGNYTGSSGGIGTTIDSDGTSSPASVTLAGDVISGTSDACHIGGGTWTDGGYNVVNNSDCLNGGTQDSFDSSLSSQLGSLGSYGGPTQTIPLLAGNPALGDIPNPGPSVSQADGSSFPLCPTVDQRGAASAAGASCDSGAVQLTALAVKVSGSQTYGSSAPSFTTSTSPPSGDTFSGTLTCSTVNNGTAIGPSLSASGSYTIDGASCSGLSLTGPTGSGYGISYEGSTFTVDKAPLTVNAPSPTAQYGNVPQTFTPTYAGLANGQTAPSTPATCTSSETNASPPGTYPNTITCSGASDPNYNISYGPAGTLTIVKAQTKLAPAPASFGLLSVTFSATLTRSDNGTPISGKTITFSVPGLALGGNCNAVTNGSGVASCTISPALVITLGPSSYTAAFAGDTDYVSSTAPGQLTSGLNVLGLALGPRSGSVRHAGTVRLTLSRSGLVYATGRGRVRHGVALLKLKLRHRPAAGRYTLTVRPAGGRAITRTITLR